MKTPSIKKGKFELDIKINGQDHGSEDITDRIEGNQHKLTYTLIKDVLESKKINFDPKKVEKWDFSEGKYIVLPKDYSLTLERETSQIIDINLHPTVRKASYNTGMIGFESMMTEIDYLKNMMHQILSEVKDMKQKIEVFQVNVVKGAPSPMPVDQQVRENEKNLENQSMNDPHLSHLDMMMMEKGISKVETKLSPIIH